VNSAPEQSAFTYGEGDILILHVLSDTDPTGGADFYDGWYHVKLVEGEKVYYFEPSTITYKGSSPTYTYTFNGGGVPAKGVVQYTAGQTPYWDIGPLYVYPRVNKTNLDIFFKAAGTTLSSVADGAAWDDTVAEINANHTMVTVSEDFYVELQANVVDVTYGMPFYTVSQQGEFQERRAVVIFSTNMTTIDLQTLYNEGWRNFASATLTAEVA